MISRDRLITKAANPREGIPVIAEQTTVKVASCAPMLEGMKKVPARTSWAIASMIQASVKVMGCPSRYMMQ